MYDGAFMRDDDARTGAPMVLSRGMRVHGYEPCEVSVAEKATLVLPVRWWREADHLWGEGYRLRKEEDRLLVEEEESVRFRVSDVTRAYNELAAAELAGVTITSESEALFEASADLVSSRSFACCAHGPSCLPSSPFPLSRSCWVSPLLLRPHPPFLRRFLWERVEEMEQAPQLLPLQRSSASETAGACGQCSLPRDIQSSRGYGDVCGDC